VRIVDTPLGPWVCGTLKPTVTVAQVRLIRACSLSGDWRDHGDGELDLIAAQLVTTPGFPIVRESIAASGGWVPAEASITYQVERGRLVSLAAAGIVVREPAETARALVAAGCTDCARRAAQRRDSARSGRPPTTTVPMTLDNSAFRMLLDLLGQQTAALGEMNAKLAAVDIRTRHLAAAEAAAVADRVAALVAAG
jgi:hypothetical protein